MTETKTSSIVRADLRAFFTIGFQDAPNGLWLGIHRIPRQYLFQRFVTTCFDAELGLVALTTEDDRILPKSAEDRWGHLAYCDEGYPFSAMYRREVVDEGLFKVTRT